MNQLQSPTLALTNASLVDNTLFNTGLATQLAPPFAMAIHAIRWNISIGQPTEAQDSQDNVIVVLSEDVGGTIASDELTDPRTLAEAGTEWIQQAVTAVGALYLSRSLLWTARFDPPIWTIAQRLNIIGQIVETVATSAPDATVHMKLFYTIEPVDQKQMSELVQRLNLATQP